MVVINTSHANEYEYETYIFCIMDDVSVDVDFFFHKNRND